MLCSAARSARALYPFPACCPREAIPAQSSGGGTGWGAQRCGVLPGGVALPSLTDSCFGSAPAQDSPLLLNAQCHAWLLGNPPPHTHTLTHRSHLVRLCLGGHPTRGAWPAIAQTGKEMKLPEPRCLSQCHLDMGCDAITGVSA